MVAGGTPGTALLAMTVAITLIAMSPIAMAMAIMMPMMVRMMAMVIMMPMMARMMAMTIMMAAMARSAMMTTSVAIPASVLLGTTGDGAEDVMQRRHHGVDGITQVEGLHDPIAKGVGTPHPSVAQLVIPSDHGRPAVHADDNLAELVGPVALRELEGPKLAIRWHEPGIHDGIPLRRQGRARARQGATCMAEEHEGIMQRHHVASVMVVPLSRTEAVPFLDVRRGKRPEQLPGEWRVGNRPIDELHIVAGNPRSEVPPSIAAIIVVTAILVEIRPVSASASVPIFHHSNSVSAPAMPHAA